MQEVGRLGGAAFRPRPSTPPPIGAKLPGFRGKEGPALIVQLEQLTIRRLLERSFRLFGSLPALATAGEPPISYHQLQQETRKLAADLLKQGIAPGDRVAILGENSPQWVVAYLACAWIGAVAVPILPGFPETDTRHIVRHSGAETVFVAEKHRGKLENGAGPMVRRLYSLEDLSLATDLAAARPSFWRRLVDRFRWRTGRLRTPAPELPEDAPGPQEDDLAAILYTSGTTGYSKGVMLTHRNLVFDAVHSIERFPISSSDRFLSILPLSHAFEATGGLLCPLAVGASMHYLKGLPTPAKLLEAAAAVRPTAILAVPLVIDKIYRKKILPQLQEKRIIRVLYGFSLLRRQLHKLAGRKLLHSLGGELRFFMFGGAAMSEDVEQFLREAKISYSTGYGMTETAPILTINPFGAVKPGSCGKPIPGIEIKIYRPDPGTGVGEVIVRGANVTQGYYRNPAVTEESFLPGKWLKTGDLGFIDAEGYLFLKGRSKNMILGPSGENIYPEAIEQLLGQAPYVQECVVFEQNGKLIALAYLDYDAIDRDFAREKGDGGDPAPRVTRLLETIRKEANQQLPVFARLAQIFVHPEPFEKTPTNKVKRHLYIGKPMG